jgi:hypothetical protein
VDFGRDRKVGQAVDWKAALAGSPIPVQRGKHRAA